MNGSFKDLKVYRKAYELATEIFRVSQTFPKEERYALMDQIRRSSRSVCANIAEAYRKRRYIKHFTSKITDADGEASETLVWIDFARDAVYLKDNSYDSLAEGYEEVGRMLGGMADHPERFLPKTVQVSDDLAAQYGFDDD
ncbi:MAG: four helix bundle protein [Candidatus Marinimicrobia bacterium]|nr:four helix bundle protein [Candidatus Neomarinimicrobiota bacterium]